MRQRTQWNSEGTAVAITWSRSQQLRNYMRSLTLENARALLVSLKKAHSDFQHNARNTNFENWHESIDENSLILPICVGAGAGAGAGADAGDEDTKFSPCVWITLVRTPNCVANILASLSLAMYLFSKLTRSLWHWAKGSPDSFP